MRCSINGVGVEVGAHPLSRLLDVLREELGLTGTKEGCGEGECGACTVLIDGEPVCSCLVPLAHAEGREVTTIEGLGGDHPLQHAFAKFSGAQCGICTPGMIMAALGLPAGAPIARLQEALAGNLCRCTGYEAIYRALRAASAGAGASAGGTATAAATAEATAGAPDSNSASDSNPASTSTSNSTADL